MTKPNYIVGIGASAGGLEALEVFFANIAPHTGVTYLVIQHLSPDFKSMMAEILRRYTTLPIYEMENGMRVEADSIYLNIPRHDVRIRHGRLVLTPSSPASTAVRPINLFFESLAEDYGQHAIGVILSGSGQDGAKGVSAIHAARGLTLVQGLETALFSGMPQSATRAVPEALILA
ncbi:MAG: chemotaxis protein CheB, partial [Chloroflexota bacterium]